MAVSVNVNNTNASETEFRMTAKNTPDAVIINMRAASEIRPRRVAYHAVNSCSAISSTTKARLTSIPIPHTRPSEPPCNLTQTANPIPEIENATTVQVLAA